MATHIDDASLKAMNKSQLINIIRDYESKLNDDFDDMKSNLEKLNAKLDKLESDNKIVSNINSKLVNRTISLERRIMHMEQYSRKECLELSGIPDSVTDNNLEEFTLKIFDAIDAPVCATNIESCHRLFSYQKPNKVIVKLSRRKDAENIMSNKNKLRTVDKETIGVNTPIYINESLCRANKVLWSKCRRLKNEKFLHAFWVTNGSIKLKVNENSTANKIEHHEDLRHLFPNADV